MVDLVLSASIALLIVGFALAVWAAIIMVRANRRFRRLAKEIEDRNVTIANMAHRRDRK